MKTLTYADLRAMLEAETARLQNLIETEGAKKACNYRKTLTACINCEKLVVACGDKFKANSELYTADRETPVPNYGTVAEQALFYLMTHKATGKSAKNGYDHTLRGKRVEYKACLSASSKNTPYTPTDRGLYRDVLLVNTCGVWYIPADEAKDLTEKYGRFKHNGDYSEYIPDDLRDLCDLLTTLIFG